MKVLSFETEAKTLNDMTFTYYYNKLKLLVMSKFEYPGIEEIDLKDSYIERILFEKGFGIFYDAKESVGLMIAEATTGKINHFKEPTHLTPSGIDVEGVKEYEVGSNCVYFKNNDLALPSEYEVRLFAYRLACIKRSQDININAQKTPILVLCSDKQKLTLKNVYKQYKGNEPVIFGDKHNNSISGFQVLKTDAPIVFDKLQIQFNQTMNEFLTMFGFDNANTDKKERQIVDEVEANNQEVKSYSALMFKARKEAINEINKLFGTKIRVQERVLNLADFGLDFDKEKTDSEGSEEEVA